MTAGRCQIDWIMVSQLNDWGWDDRTHPEELLRTPESWARHCTSLFPLLFPSIWAFYSYCVFSNSCCLAVEEAASVIQNADAHFFQRPHVHWDSFLVAVTGGRGTKSEVWGENLRFIHLIRCQDSVSRIFSYLRSQLSPCHLHTWCPSAPGRGRACHRPSRRASLCTVSSPLPAGGCWFLWKQRWCQLRAGWLLLDTGFCHI